MTGKTRIKNINKNIIILFLCFVNAILLIRLIAVEHPGLFDTKRVPISAAPDETPQEPEPPKDTEPPVVSASDFEITVGDTVSYRKHISVSDNMDDDPVISIDNSAVDLETPGSYDVVYTVYDSSGNQTCVTVTLTVKEKVYSFSEDADEWLSHEAQIILKQITDDDMNDMQKGYAIYYWTKKHIAYSDTSDKSDYRIAARDGFLKRRGDCFTYFAVSKVLLTEAGIQNKDMVKLRKSNRESRHYWSLINIGTGWYHFDCTQYRYPKSNFYMVTDAELKKWDRTYYASGHRYDPEGMPKMATKSVQSMINYKSSKLVLPADE